MDTEYHILCRGPSEKRGMLLAAQKYRTRLRVRACRYTNEAAKRQLNRLRADYPGFLFKLVKAQ